MALVLHTNTCFSETKKSLRFHVLHLIKLKSCMHNTADGSEAQNKVVRSTGDLLHCLLDEGVSGACGLCWEHQLQWSSFSGFGLFHHSRITLWPNFVAFWCWKDLRRQCKHLWCWKDMRCVIKVKIFYLRPS